MTTYGYKVCYREQGKTCYVRHFLTYTKSQAKHSLNYYKLLSRESRDCPQTHDQGDGAFTQYIRYPPTAREDGHLLIKPHWKIIPVSRKEVLAGIWDEPPF